MSRDPSDTKNRILDVAEDLFAEQGLDRVSVRDITDTAQVNLAAVNYHFGGKEDLIAAVLQRRIGPVNDARIAALDKIEKAAGGKPPKVEDIIGAFILPTLSCCPGDTKRKNSFSKLFGRCLAETRPDVEKLLVREFDPMAQRLEAALTRALPHLTRAQIFLRLKFTFGVLHHWLLTKDRFLPEWASHSTMEEQATQLIAFVSTGFKAK
jgi:AcrR family transcriptional regulator